MNEKFSTPKLFAAKLRTATIATALTVANISPVHADDTEVFFGQLDRTQNNQPNVMFVLDTSGSMGKKDGQTLSRLDRMKNAMRQILNQSSNINVGLMRFNGGGSGGAVIYPITPIDDKVCATNDCGELSLNIAIASANDDIEEHTDGRMDFDGNVLSLDPNSVAGAEKKIGLRFTDVNIPQGARITQASITVTAQSGDGSSGGDFITIRAEQSKDSAPYTTANSDASSRSHGTLTTWTPGRWGAGNEYKTSDLTTQVQEIVNRGDWCGGNALSFLLTGAASRDIVSYNSEDPRFVQGQPPILNVTYDTTSIPTGGGCASKFITAQVTNGNDDAEQHPNDNAFTTSPDLELFGDNKDKGSLISQYIGVRFNNIQIPKNAKILDARIEFSMRKDSFGNNAAWIIGEASDNPRQFSNKYNNISNRPLTSQRVHWGSLPARVRGEKLITEDLSNIVTGLTTRNGWKPGNSMAFLMYPSSSTGKHPTESYNGNPANAPKLRIKYQSTVQPSTEEPSFLIARDHLLNELDSMRQWGGTPLVGAYHESVQYFLGGDVDYGTQRGVSKPNRKNRVSHPLSYTGGTVYRESGCTDGDIENEACISETILGNARYISPMESSCQTNHIVLLSDGEASGSAGSANQTIKRVENTIGSVCSRVASNLNESCGLELAEWLAKTDLSATHQNVQNIKTYTIGFNVDLPFLEDIASKGKGQYFRADSSADLVASFEDILEDVYSIDTSFVAPGATVNQFNRLTHRNDIYFAVFKPEETPTWSGNLKKYEVGLTADGNPTVFDFSTPRKQAVDPDTGFFASNASSGWSTHTDGSSVASGGAAEQLTFRSESGTGADGRRLYTVLTDSATFPVSLKDEGDWLHELNTELQNHHLDLNGLEGNVNGIAINRNNLLRWARGVDVKDRNDNGDVSELRGHMGDPMHSRPVIVNYAKNESESFTTIFVGTNEGVLHGFDSATGEELFGFMPEALLPNIRENFINTSSIIHPYGLDGPISTWTIDSNNNVVVDPDETAMLYVGMRRGGSNYYAFDIADRRNPKLKWIIKGGPQGDAGFSQLGQTWSTMEPTKIRINGQMKNVLIFGGGYDTGNDVDRTIGAVPKVADTIGRAIFIVDADTGELLYQLGHTSDTGADQTFRDMNFAFAAGIRVTDFDGNGFADTMFASDMGGQVWRFDFDLYHDSGPLFHNSGYGVIAKLGNLGTSSLSNSRRFFDEPDVALIRENGQRYISISVGSGWRSHPLNTDVQDRIYSLRSYDIFTLPEGYGRKTSTGGYTPVTEHDLTDVTNDLHPNVSPHGWMMRFDEPGEKVSGQVQTANGSLIFTTYKPEANVAACSTALGSGAAWAVRVSDGRPALDLNEDGVFELTDRFQNLTQSGLPPEASILILEGEVVESSNSPDTDSETETNSDDGGSSEHTPETESIASTEIKPAVFVAGESIFEDLFEDSLTRREFWIDAGMTSAGAARASIDPEAGPTATGSDQPSASSSTTSAENHP